MGNALFGEQNAGAARRGLGAVAQSYRVIMVQFRLEDKTGLNTQAN